MGIAFGKSIRIYLKDATVTGIRFGEIVNHTIQCIACPRKRISELKGIAESGKPGIYFLFGTDETSGMPMCYVGEGENVMERLQSHVNGKDFWNEVLMFVSKDENLTKSHVRYLESRLLTIANSTKRYMIENFNQTQISPLPAADKDAMEEFLSHIELLLGVFGHKILEDLAPLKSVQQSNNPIDNLKADFGRESKSIELSLNIAGLKAFGLYTDEGFVVLENSEAAKDIQGLQPGYVEIRDRLIANGTMVLEGSKYVFKNKFLFKTPSPAGAVIVGYSINGRDCWKDKNGRSLNDIEKTQLENSIMLN